jgi:hypothetical protein
MSRWYCRLVLDNWRRAFPPVAWTPAFDEEHLATRRVSMPNGSGDADTGERESVRRVSVLAGVQPVGMTGILPAQCDWSTDMTHFPGKPRQGESLPYVSVSRTPLHFYPK